MKRALLLSILCGLPLLAAAADSFLIHGATVHPISGPDIPGGDVLVQNGKIAGVGAHLSAPAGVQVIDAQGMHIYPGMIDSATQIGLSEIGSIRETNDLGELGDFNPQLRALIAVNPESEHISVTRVNGITSVITLPAATSSEGRGGGSASIIPGQAALIHLDGWTWEEMALKRTPAMMLRFPVIPGAPSRYAAAMGMAAQQRTYADAKKAYDAEVKKLDDFFESARRYRQAKAAHAADFKPDLKLDAMIPVLEGQQPVMVVAVKERTIQDAIAWADKQKVKIILAEVRQPGKMLSVIKEKNIPVVLPQTLALPLNEDDPYDAAATLPEELYKAGVKFCFGSFTTEFSRNLPYQAAHAVAFGLPHDAALQAVTLNAAQIWGVADRVGSIEEGKLADLVVTDGDILEAKTNVKRLFINGKPVSLKNKQTELYEKYMNRP